MGAAAVSYTRFCFSICNNHNTRLVIDMLAVKIFYLIYSWPFFVVTCKNYNIEAAGLKTNVSWRVANLLVDCDIMVSFSHFGL